MVYIILICFSVPILLLMTLLDTRARLLLGFMLLGILVATSAYEIIAKKHATYYGIAMSVKRICEVIVRNEKSILPVSTMMHGEYGIEGIALSMPAIVGLDGVETHVPIVLDEGEREQLRRSAETLKQVAAGLNL